LGDADAGDPQLATDAATDPGQGDTVHPGDGLDHADSATASDPEVAGDPESAADPVYMADPSGGADTDTAGDPTSDADQDLGHTDAGGGDAEVTLLFPPELVVPTSVAGSEDSPVPFDGLIALQSLLPLTFTLSLDGHGTLYDLAGDHGPSLTLAGSQEEVLAKLADLQLQPEADFWGTIGVTVAAENADGACSASFAVAIGPANDAPTLVAATPVTLAWGTTDLTGLQVNDVDGDTLQLVLLVNRGKLLLPDPGVPGVTYLVAPGTAAANLRITGTAADLTSALAQLAYVSDLTSTTLGATLTLLLTESPAATPPLQAMATVSLQLVVSATPAIVTARIADNGGSIRVVLDSPLDPAHHGTVFACNTLFNAAALGASPTCMRNNLVELTVLFGSGATLMPGDTLSTVTHGLWLLGATAALPQALTAVVAAPSNPAIPAVTIFGPATVNPCGTVTLTTSATNGLGRPLAYAWTSSDLTLNGATTNAALSIDATTLPLGQNVTVTATVSNWLGGTNAASHTFAVTTPGITVTIQGEAALQTTRPQVLALQALVSAPTCGTDLVQYTWSSEPALTLGDPHAAVLFLPANTLAAGTTYVMTVAVKRGQAEATASVTVEVVAQALVAMIAGGDFRTVAILSEFTMDGSASYDPDAPTELPTYTWSCTDIDGAPCLDLGTSTALVLPSVAQFNLPAGSLAVGTYEFALAVTKDTRTSTATQIIQVLPGAPPLVALMAPSTYINPTGRLRVFATVSGSSPFIYLWSEADDAVPIADPGAVVLDLNATGAFVFEAGATYTFMLAVTDSAGQTGYASLAVRINAPPGGGPCTVSPSTLQAFSSYTIQCPGFSDPDAPLRFQYFSRNAMGTKTALAAWTTSSTFVGTAPGPGNYELGADVSDSLGLSVESAASVTVVLP